MEDQARVDLHQHVLPPDYVTALQRRGIDQAGGRALPAWSAEQAIAMMDSRSIATGLLSVSAPGVHLGDDGEAARLAGAVNDHCAELVKDRPDRFGFFASVPLPDLDGALTHATRALDHLGADGVVLLANNHGRYLGDPAFDPLMTELDRRRAVVFVHPAELPGGAVEGIAPFAADFLLDTTRAAYNLVLHDIPRRFPNITVILAHAGGFLPYAAHRVTAALIAETGREPAALLEELASFHFDTALSASPTALPSLLAFAAPGHVHFGSDWPFAPEPAVSYFTDQLDAYDLDAGTRAAINHRNAHQLVPRLA